MNTLKNTFKVVISQGNFSFSKEYSTNNDTFNVLSISQTAINALAKGMILAKIDYNSATYNRKDKAGNIVSSEQRRAKFSEPFTVEFMTTSDEMEGEWLTSSKETMKFSLGSESGYKTSLKKMVKRIYAFCNDGLGLYAPYESMLSAEIAPEEVILLGN